jgi:heme exporter protein CcmD
MKDYAWYVWGSYGVAFLVFFLELLVLRIRSRKHETKT